MHTYSMHQTNLSINMKSYARWKITLNIVQNSAKHRQTKFTKHISDTIHPIIPKNIFIHFI